MHVRYSRAAVAGESPSSSVPSRRAHQAQGATLWASRPLAVSQGRLIAVRLTDDLLTVLLVRGGDQGSRWLPAETLLTAWQAEVWARSSEFRR
jgi:hypothetical protein